MPIFGEIINTKLPVLIVFFADWHPTSEKMTSILRETAIVLGEDAKVVKMDVDKNRELTKALVISGLPTHILYFRGEEVWRKEGLQASDELVNIVHQYIKK